MYLPNKERKDCAVEIRDELVKSCSVNGEGPLGNNSGANVIVAGTSVAGAALAHTLGMEGRRVHVIERDLTEPDRIAGELLQPEEYLKLVELGLKVCVEEIDAQRVLGYALFKDDVAGRSFHNGREKAVTLPNVRLVQGTVTSLLEENGTIQGIQYKSKSGQELKAYASLTIVCDGCFSNLHCSLCDP